MRLLGKVCSDKYEHTVKLARDFKKKVYSGTVGPVRDWDSFYRSLVVVKYISLNGNTM